VKQIVALADDRYQPKRSRPPPQPPWFPSPGPTLSAHRANWPGWRLFVPLVWRCSDSFILSVTVPCGGVVRAREGGRLAGEGERGCRGGSGGAGWMGYKRGCGSAAAVVAMGSPVAGAVVYALLRCLSPPCGCILDGMTSRRAGSVMNAIKAHQSTQSSTPSRPRSLSRSSSFPAAQHNKFIGSVDGA
jgi:hypothetical protein